MSVGASTPGEQPISAQAASANTTTKPPPRRTVTAKADVLQQPEAR